MLRTVSMIVREATVADVAQLASVHVASWQAAYAGLLPAPYLASLSVAERTRSWERVLEDLPAEQVVLVAEVDQRVVGFSRTGPSRDESTAGRLELRALYLEPECWGGGLGAALHDEAVRGWDVGVAGGPAAGVLWVLATNERARRFYERRGWVDDGVSRSDVSDGLSLDLVRYSWPLAVGVWGGNGSVG